MTLPTRFTLEKLGDDLGFYIPDETAAALGVGSRDYELVKV